MISGNYPLCVTIFPPKKQENYVCNIKSSLEEENISSTTVILYEFLYLTIVQL